MARIKWFEVEGIAIYIYGELYEKHHVPHLLIRKSTVESTQYGFDGNPIRGCKRLSNLKDHKLVSSWILSKKEKLNIGVSPRPRAMNGTSISLLPMT